MKIIAELTPWPMDRTQLEMRIEVFTEKRRFTVDRILYMEFFESYFDRVWEGIGNEIKKAQKENAD